MSFHQRVPAIFLLVRIAKKDKSRKKEQRSGLQFVKNTSKNKKKLFVRGVGKKSRTAKYNLKVFEIFYISLLGSQRRSR